MLVYFATVKLFGVIFYASFLLQVVLAIFPKKVFPSLFARLYSCNKAYTRTQIIAGFECTGPFPLNQDNIDNSKLQMYHPFNNNLITSQAITNSPHSPSSSSQTAQQTQTLTPSATPASIPPTTPTSSPTPTPISIPTLNLISQEELAIRVKISLERALLKQFQFQNAYKHPAKKARSIRTVAGQALTEEPWLTS